MTPVDFRTKTVLYHDEIGRHIRNHSGHGTRFENGAGTCPVGTTSAIGCLRKPDSEN